MNNEQELDENQQQKIQSFIDKGFSQEFLKIHFNTIENSPFKNRFKRTVPHPFYALKRLMLSKFDLFSIENQLKDIDKEQLNKSDEILEKYGNDLFGKSFDSVDFNLTIQAGESFALIKYIFNEQLITNRENDFDDLNQLQEDLIFGAENTSFLSFFSNYLKAIIDLYIGYFKNELFNVGDE